jgi:carbamoyltransferase
MLSPLDLENTLPAAGAMVNNGVVVGFRKPRSRTYLGSTCLGFASSSNPCMSNQHTYVLGINAYDHDVSACLLRDGEIAFAINKERITRKKHDSGFYQGVVDYCLAAEGIPLGDVDLVVRNCYVLPVHELEVRMVSQDVPEVMDDKERIQAAKNPLYLARSDKVLTVSHHLAHAYSAFAASPFNEGVVMVVDGVGNYCADVREDYPLAQVNPLARESESYYRFSGAKIETLRKVWLNPVRGFLSDEFYYMPGLGALYSRVSSYIFADWNKCGEVMGLAPYGRPGAVKPLIEMRNGDLTVPDWGVEFDKPWLVDRESNWEASASMQHWKDMAWRVQDDAEKVLLERAIWLRESTGAKNLCMAGGVALNCVANGRIWRESGFENVWIQPAAGDDGIAIGCAYYGHLALLKNERRFVQAHSFLGMEYEDKDVAAAARRKATRLQATTRVSSDICAEAASLLAQGNTLGWFQGRSEFGPRALGNRSIIADPRDPGMKDKLNKRVKHRQAFRPFAPLVLAERVNDIFEAETESPFMLLVARVRPQWQDRIPAIVHVDGTARLQTVRREHNAQLYRLLKEFEALTGVPVLLNTSFNVKGEPIVETPQDAINCFLATGLDYLVLHDLLLSKKPFHRIVAPVVKARGEIASLVRAAWSAEMPH